MAGVVPKYSVRKATRTDVAAIKNLIDINEWEVPADLLYCTFDMDSRAWFVAESDTGEILGCRLLVYFNEETVAGGIYLIREELRGKGIGGAVNLQSLKAVAGANITISATFVHLYDSHGFTFYYDVHQRRGPVEIILGAIPDTGTASGVTIVPYNDTMFTELKAYDEQICESERDYFFKNWIISHAKCALIARSHAGRVVGYGCLRFTEYGNEIAPLYADSDIIAWTLLKDLLQHLDPKDTVHLFITSENKAVMESIGEAPLTNLFTLHKMYTAKSVPQNLDRLYSLSAIALSVV